MIADYHVSLDPLHDPIPGPDAELERLGDEIAELSAHLDAATARLLDLIREFDARGGWGSGFRSCAAWLSWRVGLDPSAARERVRVARALGGLPRLAQALARGELSYSKVRALTRIATPEAEERLLIVGKAGTAEHVERIVRGWRWVDRAEEVRDTETRHRGRALHVYEDDDGMVIVRGRLEPEIGAVLMQALAAARETLRPRAPSPSADMSTKNVSAEAPTGRDTWTRNGIADVSTDSIPVDTPTFEQQQADALGLLAETALHHGLNPGAPAEHFQVVVHVDAPVLTDGPGQAIIEDGARVSAETSQRLACDASRVIMRHGPDGRVTRRSGRGRGRSRRRCGGRFSIGTAAVGSRAAVCGSARAITSSTGRTADRQRCRISRCCVAGTTEPCTKKAMAFRDSRAPSWNFACRAARYYRRSRRPLQQPLIRPAPFERKTKRAQFAFTRARRYRAGPVTASISAMRSTSCGRGGTRARPRRPTSAPRRQSTSRRPRRGGSPP